MLQLAVFAIGSAGLVLFSRPALRVRRTHGFYRFFAFESILALIVLAAPRWFRDPLSARQIASWLLLLSSLLLAAHGFYLLRVIGRPQGQFENTTRLVTRGAYRTIRHPLYSSLLLLGWGAFLKSSSPAGLRSTASLAVALALAASAALFATARVEEGENLARFGAEYAAYMKTTRMFVPWLF